MRILLVRASSDGGVRRHVVQSANLLAGEHTVLLAAPDTHAGECEGSWRPVAVPIADRPRPSDLSAWRDLRRLAADADIVHAHGLRAGALCALAAGSTPLVLTVHNRPVGSGAVRAMGAILLRIAMRRAAVVLAVSPDLAEMARAAGAKRCLPAIVPAPPRDTSATHGDIRAELGLEPQTQVLVTVARLAPQKGLPLLAEVAGRLPPGAIWLIAGDGPQRAWLTERIQADHLPIRLLGQREDVANLLASADLVVSTAHWEGQPVWLQEALQAGAAIVATDVGGSAQVLGGAGILVPPDPDRLAGQIITLLADPHRRAELRHGARQRANQLPDAGDLATQLTSVYTDLSTFG